MKTEQERLKMVGDLRAIKPFIIKESYFGEDHWSAIDAQIWVLQNAKYRRQIEDRYQDNEDGDFPNSAYELESALIAWDWINEVPLDAGQTAEEWWGELREDED